MCSLMAKLAYFCLFYPCFLSIIGLYIFRHWSLYLLDIKNDFPCGDVEEELSMKEPPTFVVQGQSSLVC